MRHVGVFSFALVLGSMTLLAQSSGRTSSQLAVARVMQPSVNCPVEMWAQRQTGIGQLLGIPTDSNRQTGPVQELRVTFTNSALAQMVGMRITVYGLNSKGQLSPATAAEPSAINKIIDLKLNAGPQSQTSADLLLPGFTSVTFISVDSIRYAGGSKWTPSAAHSCRVIPNPGMLISSR